MHGENMKLILILTLQYATYVSVKYTSR